MNEFLEIVKERPDKSLKKENTICPYCKSQNIKEVEHTYTLVGGDPDPNHHWIECICNDCSKSFTKEYKYENVWYTDDRKKVLAGIPSCFESYIYTCKKCGGVIIRQYHDISDGSIVTTLKTINIKGKWVKQYTIHFLCLNCGCHIESESEYYE